VKIPGGLDDIPHQQATTMPRERVRSAIRGNCHLTLQVVADKVGFSIGYCYQIFTEKLQMSHVSAKFVPPLLTEDQTRHSSSVVIWRNIRHPL
jgi:hypothetical protein